MGVGRKTFGDRWTQRLPEDASLFRDAITNRPDKSLKSKNQRRVWYNELLAMMVPTQVEVE